MIPVVVEPDVVPVQIAIVPKQIADTQVTRCLSAKNASPEEDVASFAVFIFLPVFWKQFRVVVQVVENIAVEEHLLATFELLAEFVTRDWLVVQLRSLERRVWIVCRNK